ncbi:hypothetical protein BB934_26455 [Microvirga ossetica]|uniref:Uncharacterized protein n=1 Tax=Microvirga ossetica TaxID=1882682 RepID=A0A1B2EMW8_9HYPH|nr:hypothetical protein [Microvirga ossetica]ANY81326.1 hypothetical protein BB934_26455 [Microvirga ossetica]
MSGKRHKDIRAGRGFPSAAELEAGFPFHKDSIREDMSIWVESKVRQKPEEQDSGWDRSRYLVALRWLRDSARDSLKTDEDLAELVLQVIETLPPWAPADHLRCWAYWSQLTAQPPMGEEHRRTLGASADVNAGKLPGGQAARVGADSLDRHPISIMPQANDHPGRMKDILAGKAWPEAIELLRGMPFFKGSLHEDMRHYAGRLLGGIERDVYRRDDWDDYEASIIHQARRLRKAASNEASTQWDFRPIIERLLFTFPRDYREGWLRCSYYRAALGVRWAQVDMASTAVSLALVSAKAGSPSESDYQLIATALGWLAELAVDELALVEQPKPICCDAPEDTARHYGQMLVDFMRMPPTRSGP